MQIQAKELTLKAKYSRPRPEPWTVRQCTGVCMDGHFSTLLTTSSQPLILLLAVIVYDLKTWTISLCLAVDSAHTAVGLFIMLDQQSGFWNSLPDELRNTVRTALIVLNGFWKQFCSVATSVTSTLEVFFLRDALYKSKFYLLTYFSKVNHFSH